MASTPAPASATATTATPEALAAKFVFQADDARAALRLVAAVNAGKSTFVTRPPQPDALPWLHPHAAALLGGPRYLVAAAYPLKDWGRCEILFAANALQTMAQVRDWLTIQFFEDADVDDVVRKERPSHYKTYAAWREANNLPEARFEVLHAGGTSVPFTNEALFTHWVNCKATFKATFDHPVDAPLRRPGVYTATSPLLKVALRASSLTPVAHDGAYAVSFTSSGGFRWTPCDSDKDAVLALCRQHREATPEGRADFDPEDMQGRIFFSPAARERVYSRWYDGLYPHQSVWVSRKCPTNFQPLPALFATVRGAQNEAQAQELTSVLCKMLPGETAGFEEPDGELLKAGRYDAVCKGLLDCGDEERVCAERFGAELRRFEMVQAASSSRSGRRCKSTPSPSGAPASPVRAAPPKAVVRARRGGRCKSSPAPRGTPASPVRATPAKAPKAARRGGRRKSAPAPRGTPTSPVRTAPAKVNTAPAPAPRRSKFGPFTIPPGFFGGATEPAPSKAASKANRRSPSPPHDDRGKRGRF